MVQINVHNAIAVAIFIKKAFDQNFEQFILHLQKRQDQ